MFLSIEGSRQVFLPREDPGWVQEALLLGSFSETVQRVQGAMCVFVLAILSSRFRFLSAGFGFFQDFVGHWGLFVGLPSGP